MGTNSNTLLTNWFFLVTISSSVISLPYDTSNFLIPKVEAKYSHHFNIADWKDNAFNKSPDYNLHNEDSERILTIVEFSKKILKNTIDIESEYVDVVNENFWDLI